MLSVIMLSVIMLSVIMLSVIMLSVTFYLFNAECRYANCLYAVSAWRPFQNDKKCNSFLILSKKKLNPALVLR
jgi:hypothetical protein